jgi:hypothetical protein
MYPDDPTPPETKSMTQDRQLNQAAYRRLAASINETYPPGRFVAIAGGQVVADAARFDELHARLTALGISSPDTLIVEAGVEDPDSVVIFT